MHLDYSIFERRHDDLLVSNDRARLDLDAVHRMLRGSYWATNIPRDVVAASIDGSMPFGAYDEAVAKPRQVGFARVISDGATFGYLADVFVEPEYRRRGLGRHLVETALAHPELQRLRRWMLVTRDAHSLYTRFGFTAAESPGNIMVRRLPDPYGAS